MSDRLMDKFLGSSYFSGGNAAYIENLYEDYLHRRDSVPFEWKQYLVYRLLQLFEKIREQKLHFLNLLHSIKH